MRDKRDERGRDKRERDERGRDEKEGNMRDEREGETDKRDETSEMRGTGVCALLDRQRHRDRDSDTPSEGASPMLSVVLHVVPGFEPGSRSWCCARLGGPAALGGQDVVAGGGDAAAGRKPVS